MTSDGVRVNVRSSISGENGMGKIKYLLNLCPEDKKALIWDLDKNTATCCLCKKQYELVVEINDMTEENRERNWEDSLVERPE